MKEKTFSHSLPRFHVTYRHPMHFTVLRSTPIVRYLRNYIPWMSCTPSLSVRTVKDKIGACNQRFLTLFPSIRCDRLLLWNPRTVQLSLPEMLTKLFYHHRLMVDEKRIYCFSSFKKSLSEVKQEDIIIRFNTHLGPMIATKLPPTAWPVTVF